jgi:2'-5' RNA ligase
VRLFVGIELSEQMKSAAAAAAERLQAALKRARLRIQARWVPPENLHVTLWFIGEVKDDRAADIQAALNAPFEIAPFTLGVQGLGAFPPSGPPRVFWMGVTSGKQELAALHAALALRLAPLGIEPEHRTFSAHVTLARIKDVPRGAPADIRRILAATAADAGSASVSAATLFRSRVSSKGSSYEPLLRIPLA